MKRAWVWAPLALFALFAGLAAWRLQSADSRPTASALVGRPMPVFTLPPAVAGKPGIAGAGAPTGGGARLVNVFASWCVPCIAEAPVLMELKRRGIAIDAIAIRDKPEDVAAFLKRNGDPFDRIGSDRESRVQISLGSSGVQRTPALDRHWRNARTLTSHNPRIYKERVIGDFYLNGGDPLSIYTPASAADARYEAQHEASA